jgi:hypothetical protein
MRVADAEQLVQPVAERRLQMPLLELLQVERAVRKHGARQPARSGRPVVPNVLQDVRHLQALAERHRQPQHDFALRLELRAMQAEKLRAHLADDTGDVIAVLRELIEVFEPSQALAALKLRHPATHDCDATRQCSALLGRARVRHADHRRRVPHEVVLGGQHAIGKQRRQIARELLGRLRSIDDGDEPRMELRLLVGWEARVVLDRVGDSAEQIGVRHDDRQSIRQDGDRESEGA